jgi:GNAT superfamily N-acetyltransferase
VSPEPRVIAATPSHAARLSALLIDVFAADSFYLRAFAGPGYTERLERHLSATVDETIAAGLAFTTEACDSIALWAHTGSPPPPAREKPETYHALIAQLTPYAPPPPNVYLNLLATAPAARGKGAASALTRHMFVWADARGWPIYLETQKPENVGFYERLGFAVTQRIDAIAGLPMWAMRRAPR